MGTSNEPIPPDTVDTTPLPRSDGKESLRALPTARNVLEWVAEAGGSAWFPSQHAAATGIHRDTLDEPLSQLRLAGLIEIATWVRGMGQGYVLTAEGRAAVGLPQPPLPAKQSESPVSESVPAAPDELNRPLAAVSDYRPAPSLNFENRPPLIVPLLLIANLVWFFVGLAVALRDGQSVWSYLSGGNVELLHRLGGVRGLDLIQGDWWRLLSSCFVHAGGMHILVNLLALGMIGPLAELLWGRGRFLVIYLFSGIGGSCLAMAVRPEVVLIGASGAIWGVLTSLMMWFVLFRPHLPREVAADSIRRLVIVIALNAMFSFLPGISWAGHLGGGVVGFLTAGLLNALRFGNRPRRYAALGLLAAIPVLCIGGLLVAMQRGEAWAAYRQHVADEEQRLARIEKAREAALAQEQLQQRIEEAVTSYNQTVVPLLNQLKPELVEPVEQRAVIQALLPGPRRNTERVAEVRKKLAELKTAADTAIGHLTAPPTGTDAIDQRLAQAKLFAEARSRSLGLLLAMLAVNTVPDQAAWDAWGKDRRTANTLWGGVRN